MTSTSLDVAQRITEFVLGSTPRTMPAEALKLAKIGVIDSLGVALAGSLEESSLICADFARREGGWPEASIIGRDFKVSTTRPASSGWTNSNSDRPTTSAFVKPVSRSHEGLS